MTIFNPSKNLCATALLSASLVGCGGGGGGGGSAAGPSTDAASARIAGVLLAGPALTPAPAGLSGNVVCHNMSIGAIALDSVHVPPNAACRLKGTSLKGTLSVARGGMLTGARIQVTGNVQADAAAHVALVEGSSVGGSVQIKQGGTALIEAARIDGDLQLDAMHGLVSATGNRVGGSLQATGNLGGLSIERNLINANLQCKENNPSPVVAENVAALIEGQCVPRVGGGGGGGGGTVAAGPTAGNVSCAGIRIGAVQLDSVFVPANATCVLEGTRLIGSIEVGLNASLSATNVSVSGNLVADGAASTLLGGTSSIGGSVQVKQGDSVSVTGASIVGDLQIDSMQGPVTASANAIGGNLQAISNLDTVSISANRIAGALQCKGNTPPVIGGGNIATIKEDQCLSL